MPAGRKRKPVLEVRSIPVWTEVDIPTKATLDEISRTEDLSLARILRQALKEFLERRKQEAA